MPKGEYENNNNPIEVVLTSAELPEAQRFTTEISLGERIIQVDGYKKIGIPYSGIRKSSEDGCVVTKNSSSLQVVVVDGGTQIEKVPSLDAAGITGGKYITSNVERFGQVLDPSKSVTTNLRELNTKIGTDIATNHADIRHEENSYNVPYGSIAGVNIDSKNNTLEVANAGDVFVVTIDQEGKSKLLTIDDVRKDDIRTFMDTRRVADRYGLTFREAMQQRNTDSRLRPIVESMEENIRRGNTGEIRRITGAQNFDVTSSVIVDLKEIRSVIIFTDGAIPPGIEINEPEGLREFLEFVNNSDFNVLNSAIMEKVAEDPDWEKYPRFGAADDLLLLKLSL